MTEDPEPRDVSRRAFLRIAGLAGASLAVAPAMGQRAQRRTESGMWSDASTWGGHVPSSGDVAIVMGRVTLDRDTSVAGLFVQRGGALDFDPQRSRTLESTGNIVVEGRLSMRPASAHQEHRIVFRGVDEDSFVGGGLDVLDTDVGLWVMDQGQLLLRGSKRLGWARALGTVPEGVRQITLDSDPVGWRAGDELVITPTRAPSGGSDSAYDYARIRSLSGRTVRLSSATRFAHPTVDVGSREFGAEVLNLTRNVQIEGTPGGRSHVFIRSMRPQSVRWSAIRHMGPRQPDGDTTEAVLGRYPLHFHHSEDGSRRSIVRGTVVRDSGGHAFVPHMSHGITFLDCISHDTFDDAYWWDLGDRTDDAQYTRCVASLVRSVPGVQGFRLAGFALGRGRGNVARGCVSVGVHGDAHSAGFVWPEDAEGVWGFDNCVAHNNTINGIFVWQNTDRLHVINHFWAFHNGRAGIEHGAYLNRFHYRNIYLVGNDDAGVVLHAEGIAQDSLRFENVTVDGRGITDFGFLGAEPSLEGHPALVCGPSISNVTQGDYGLDYSGDLVSDRFDVRSNC